jgi:hypothetical protein
MNNRLSPARLFLFRARDMWFAVGVPICFSSVLSDSTEAMSDPPDREDHFQKTATKPLQVQTVSRTA